MGRLASTLDWSGAEEGSGVGLRVLRSDISTVSGVDGEDEPTLTFAHELAMDRSTSRTYARLMALAAWMAKDQPSGDATRLVSAFLEEVTILGRAVGALVAVSDAESDAGISALALAVSMWRSQVIEYVDALAVSDDGAFLGSSSLPEYSAGYVATVVEPALRAVADGPRGDALASRLGNIEASLARMDDTLRGRPPRISPDASGESVAVTW